MRQTILSTMAPKQLVSAMMFLLAVCWSLQLVATREPPRISSRVEHSQIARIGEQARLPCPVEGNPAPLLQWTKDDEWIHAGWERFKMQSHGLRIKDVVREDAGTYTCKATNGFGSVSVDFILYVLDVNETVTPAPEHEGEISGEEGSAVPPEFVHIEMMDEPQIMQPAGSTVRLRCRATGRPRPHVVWLKEGKVIDQIEDSENSKWLLRLANAQEEDSGKYTCKVFNSAGTINFTYTLEIVEKLKAKPELVAPHPENITVAYGGVASFLCRVRSPVQPHIQWLKKVDNPDEILNKNATITVEEQQFIVLKTRKVLSQMDGSYLNRLTINNAKPEDSGVYICLGANSMGYNIRSAYLTVEPRRMQPAATEQKTIDLPLLAIIIGLVGVVIIIVVIVIVVSIYRRQQQRNKAAIARQPRPQPHVPEKHYYDHQYAALQQHPSHAPVGLHQAQPPMGVQYNPAHMQGVGVPPGREHYMGSPYPDLHSESSVSKSGTPIPPQQQTHVHYGGC